MPSLLPSFFFLRKEKIGQQNNLQTDHNKYLQWNNELQHMLILRLTFVCLAMEGSHFSPLTFFSSCTLSSSLFAFAFAAASLASNLAKDLWDAFFAETSMSLPSTTTDRSICLN
jgi:hypothetical protein